MKRYNHVLSFGCSFTEGGGLDSPEHYRYVKGNCNIGKSTLKTYMSDHAYPAVLAKQLKCVHTNKSISRASNELILKTLYENTKNIFDGTGLLVTIQTTILSRLLLYLEDNKQFQTVNGLYGPDYIQQYYELYIKHFYNAKIEYAKLLQNIDVYSQYLKNKNIDFVWLLGDTDGEPVVVNKHTISFENESLLSFISSNKLRICDLPNNPFVDYHISERGHEVVSEKIIKHLEEYYGY